MKRVRLEITIIILYSAFSSKACLISQEKHFGNINAGWNNEDVKRQINQNCDCGKFTKDENATNPWSLFIHVSENENAICPGTIIASNLIVTSHSCFIMKGKHLNIYDLWMPVGGERNAVWNVSTVKVSSSETPGQGETFIVEKIEYNANFAVKSSLKAYPPEYDVVLVRVKADFTAGSSKFRPICFPKLNDIQNLKIDDTEAYYKGLKDHSPDAPHTFHGNLKDSGNAECEAMLGRKFSSDKHLCFRFGGGAASKMSEGGPLFVVPPGTTSAFLIGIATVVKTFLSSTGVDYNLFTNLMTLVKYIEWQAEKHGAKWCKSPTPFRVKHIESVVGRDGSPRDPWPWEKLTPSFTRDEVLDCTCGIANPRLGRIAGGEEAVPYEFGWMSLLHFYHYGRKSRSPSLCGGSIINDRMILTASHCVIEKDRLNFVKNRSPATSPEDIDLVVEVHKRYHDTRSHKHEVAAVLYHPDFVPARRKGYFDYDIALLVLKTPLTFVSGSGWGIRPVCLPKFGTPYVNVEGLNATVSGWGWTNPDLEVIPSTLQKVELRIAPLGLCGSVATSIITENNICAGNLTRFKDAARGDSGGPLMVLKNDRYTIYGIVSWGEDVKVGKETKTAALYSNVQRLVSFVEFHAARANAKWCKISGP